MRLISKYVDIGGMFELRDGKKYTMFNDINKHTFDWKIYNSSLKVNSHNLLELQIDISDAVLIGSGDSID